jgi:hypothetical protein
MDDAKTPADGDDEHHAAPAANDPANDPGTDIAPRPRPGFRSRPDPAPTDAYEKARLFAGMTRAVLGCVGFFASLLYLPIQMATPILSGVSLLMMVTGSTSVWRAVRDAPQLKMLPRLVAVGCALVAAVTVLLTVTLGAGALGPLKDLKQPGQGRDDGTVRFEMQP